MVRPVRHINIIYWLVLKPPNQLFICSWSSMPVSRYPGWTKILSGRSNPSRMNSSNIHWRKWVPPRLGKSFLKAFHRSSMQWSTYMCYLWKRNIIFTMTFKCSFHRDYTFSEFIRSLKCVNPWNQHHANSHATYCRWKAMNKLVTHPSFY